MAFTLDHNNMIFFSSHQINVTCCMCKLSNARKLHKGVNTEKHKHNAVINLVRTKRYIPLVFMLWSFSENVSHPHRNAKMSHAECLSHDLYAISTMNMNHAFFHTAPYTERQGYDTAMSPWAEIPICCVALLVQIFSIRVKPNLKKSRFFWCNILMWW